jgi:uncharacterized membrane protein YkoI
MLAFTKVAVTKALVGTALGTMVTVGSLAPAHTTHAHHHTARVEAKQEVQTLTKERVKIIALKYCKGTVKSIEWKKEKGKAVYHVHIHGIDGKEHLVKLDAKSGKRCK